MADRANKTRPPSPARVTFRLAATKPRNPLVAPAIKRAAGAHRKSGGAKRLAERDDLARTLKNADDDA